jgi:hypothetical protein
VKSAYLIPRTNFEIVLATIWNNSFIHFPTCIPGHCFVFFLDDSAATSAAKYAVVFQWNVKINGLLFYKSHLFLYHVRSREGETSVYSTVRNLNSVQVVTRKICKRFVPTNIQRETTCWQYFIIIIKKLIQEATEFNSFSSSPPSLFSIQSYRSQAREEVPLLWIRF